MLLTWRFVSVGRSAPRVGCRRFSSKKDGVPDLHQVALEGDERVLERLLVGGDVNTTNRGGQTALMGAARGGHLHLMNRLMQRGASVNRLCKNGHSAADMAQFWQQRECYDLLTATRSNTQPPKDDLPRRLPMFFSAPSEMVDRAASFRENQASLHDMIHHPKARFLLLHQLSPVTQTTKSRQKVLWTTLSQLNTHLNPVDCSRTTSNAVFLGIHKPQMGARTRGIEGLEDGAPLFALDISVMAETDVENLGEGVNIAPGVMGMLAMGGEEAGLCGQARSLLDWHQKNCFCSHCGTTTISAQGGYKRVCENESCNTRKGVHNSSHPRVDPSVITLVFDKDQQSCILARGRHFPPRMYSCVAGFVEPGETMEQACGREVEEEVGVSLSAVTYVASQPWPSPSALMLGCIGQAATTELKVDTVELEDARWFPRQEVVKMITRCHDDRLFVPPTQAIAHHLVKTWLKDTAFG